MRFLAKKNKALRGQTLVEVVVATGIVAVVLAGMVLGTSVAIKTARVARERGEARRLLADKLEEVRAQRDGDPDLFFDLGTRQEKETKGSRSEYRITTDYIETDPGLEIEVQVEVGWTDGKLEYKVEESTYLTKWE